MFGGQPGLIAARDKAAGVANQVAGPLPVANACPGDAATGSGGQAGRSCLSRLAAFWAFFHSRTAASDTGPVMSATERGTSSPNLPGRLAPARRRDALRLGEDGDEDPRLLVAVAGQRPQPAVQLGARRDVRPDALAAPAVVGRRAPRTARGCAGPATPGSGGSPAWLAAHGDEVLDVHRRDRRGVEVAEAPAQRRRPGERPLHRHLLVEQHADQQRGAVRVEQPVGLGVAGDVERARPPPSTVPARRRLLHSGDAPAIPRLRRARCRGRHAVVPAGRTAPPVEPPAPPPARSRRSSSTVRAAGTAGACRRGVPTGWP